MERGKTMSTGDYIATLETQLENKRDKLITLQNEVGELESDLSIVQQQQSEFMESLEDWFEEQEKEKILHSKVFIYFDSREWNELKRILGG